MKTISQQVKFDLGDEVYAVLQEYNSVAPSLTTHTIKRGFVERLEVTKAGRDESHDNDETPMYFIDKDWLYERYIHSTREDAEKFIEKEETRLIKEQENRKKNFARVEYERAKKTVEEYESKYK